MSTTERVVSRLNWSRPDGLSPAHYERYGDHYDLERLAWQFLRRSEDFATDCIKVETGESDAKLVAAEWGLFRFKDYRLGSKRGGVARFLPTLVRYFPNQTDKRLVKKISLEPGHVAFVLNAAALLEFSQAKEGQKKRLLRRLEKQLERMASSRDVKPKQIQLKENNYVKCLRLLDLLHEKVSPAEIKVLLKLHEKVTGRVNVDRDYYRLKEQALRLAETGYLELAVIGASRREEDRSKKSRKAPREQ